MARIYKTMGWCVGLPNQQPGYKACPYCSSTDIHYPSSSLKVDALGRPWGNDPHIPPGFSTYGSWWCFNCNRPFESWKFIPEVSGLHGELIGEDRAMF